ncbi:MAG: hypothetical protein ABW170_02775 [Candidatus Thiodiazotropha sp. L084R]
MLALYPLWRKARRVYSLTSRLPGTNRLGFQPSLALSDGSSLCTIILRLCMSSSGASINVSTRGKFGNSSRSSI